MENIWPIANIVLLPIFAVISALEIGQALRTGKFEAAWFRLIVGNMGYDHEEPIIKEKHPILFWSGLIVQSTMSVVAILIAVSLFKDTP